MIACGRCGAELPEEADFCVTCGSLLHAENAATLSTDTRRLSREVTALLADGHDADAMTACREALATNPTNGDAYAALGDIYHFQGRPRDAIQAYKQGLQCCPTEPDEVRKKLDATLDLLAGNTAATAVSDPPSSPAVTLRNVAPPPEVTIHDDTQAAGGWFTPWRMLFIVLAACAIIAWSVYSAVITRDEHYQPPRQATPLSLEDDAPREDSVPSHGDSQ